MDGNLPGQTGVFEKQSYTAYPGWLPGHKVQIFTPTCQVGPTPCTGAGAGPAFIWAMEYDPAGLPNAPPVIMVEAVARRPNGRPDSLTETLI